MAIMCVEQNPTLPQRQPSRYQRRSAAERSFALNAVPEPPEEPPLQTLPRDLLRAHVFEAVNLWDLGRLGCAAHGWPNRVRRPEGLGAAQRPARRGPAVHARRRPRGDARGRVAERCWTAIPRRPRRRRGPRRRRPTARRPGSPSTSRRGGARGGGGGRAARRRARAARRARAPRRSTPGFSGWILEDAYALAALATPSELTRIAEPVRCPRLKPPRHQRDTHAGGTAWPSLVATFLRVVDGHQLGLGTGVDALAPVSREMNLRNALRAAAGRTTATTTAAWSGTSGACSSTACATPSVVGEQPAVHRGGALFFLERPLAPARHARPRPRRRGSSFPAQIMTKPAQGRRRVGAVAGFSRATPGGRCRPACGRRVPGAEMT